MISRLTSHSRSHRRAFIGGALVVAGLFCVLPATGLGEKVVSSPVQVPIATFNGTIVSEADLAPSMAPQLQQLRQQEYDAKSKALEQIIATRLIEAEAAK